jgi:hypothetical protein
MARIYHPEVARGGNSYAQVAAPNDARYMGLYHWCGYWAQWDKIIGVDGMWWIVQGVDVNGEPLAGSDGRVRKHCTSMEASHFADKPFQVRSRYGKDSMLDS